LVTRLFSSRIGEGIIFDLRVGLFDHIQRMPIAFFTRAQTGALISRLNSDVVGAQRALTETAAGVVTIILGISMALAGMFDLEWRLTLMAIALVPIFIAPTRTMGRKLQKLIKRQMENNAAMSSQMTERFQVGGALLVKLFGRPREEVGEFSEKAGVVRDLGIKTALYGRAFFVAFSLVAAVGVGLSYLVGGRFVIDETNAFTIGELFAFTAYLMRLYAPVTMLSNVRVEVMTAMVAFERVFEILDFEPSIKESPTAVDLGRSRGHVAFENVSFVYPKASEVSLESLEKECMQHRDRDGNFALKDVSFEIPPGDLVALVGPSGAGKSTISMLLPRLYDVTEGAVKIDGHDVRELTVASLSSAIGKVTQDAHMFHDTIRANLMYAKPDAPEKEMIEAAKAAQIHDFIASLPDGYDTVAGERGYRLSGGEKQRLAIARLLLKDPAIMILDEATAHLDSESERLIQAALGEALAGRSSLVIAHRLSTIRNANEILVLKDGQIVERGTHLDLLANGGLYEELYRTQFLDPTESRSSPVVAPVGDGSAFKPAPGPEGSVE
jgi:ATP-binding cassette subfamily B protein